MTFATRELLSTQERDPFPRIKPDEGGVQPKTLAAVGAAPTYEVGTPLAYNTSTEKWVVWTHGGPNGTGTIKGILYPNEAEIDDTDDVIAQVMLQGEIHWDDVVVPSGETEANLKTALRSGPRDIGIRVVGLDKVR